MREFLSFLKRVWDVFKPFHKHLLVVLVMLAVGEALALISPYFLGKVMNSMQAVGLKGSLETALLMSALILMIAVITITIEHYRIVYQTRNLAEVLDSDLEHSTSGRMLELSPGQHLSQHSGITGNVVNQGRDSLINLLNLALYTLLPMVARVIIIVVALLWFKWFVGLLLTVVIAFATWFSFYMNGKFWGRILEMTDQGHRVGKFRSEILRNLPLVQVQAQEKRIQKEFRSKLDEYVRTHIAIWVPYMRYATARQYLIELTRWSVLLIGIYVVFKHDYAVGDFFSIWIWTSQAVMGINSISHYQRQWMRLSSEVHKYLKLLDIKPAIVVMSNPVKPDRFEGDIEFRDVSFSYPHQEYIDVGEKYNSEKPAGPALDQVSFKIGKGERVAFVGESGAGKSTIISLLVRAFDPDEGRILVDGNDLRLFDPKQFRESIGVVEQRVELFDETLRYNVLFGLNGRGPHISEVELDEIARVARIDRFMHRLPNGWDTWIGQNGIKLSGGERQRVGIARALIKRSSILILDEATSSLDTKNERMIKESIREASEGRTTIVIAHRLSTVRDADKIIVLDKGRVVSEGKHEELCETCDIYQELVESQLVAL